ncbi:unnamed protein product [Rotaria sordida]|uniref:Uncharacterized protein n=1 Tax=Rotaria sordida TaxID=392033 RepID=A0A818FYP4_9BILA|nr:unnamed protein product [Rotaria sordida]CAF3565281.1 unnamed protein product [Rotaria sordida]CAF3602509.1 unnamed protein product [Rotaria sordida]
MLMLIFQHTTIHLVQSIDLTNNSEIINVTDAIYEIFTNTLPRLCKINPNNGNIILINTTNNITEIYPYYLTQTINNSYCPFTFYTIGQRVSIDCINESSTLPETYQ